jgi:hypothetical protein
MSGCASANQPVCSNLGNASYPSWTAAAGSTCQHDCTSTCPAANPNDNLPDDVALQACLNAGGTIALVPGSVGYILSRTLTIPHSNTTITSAAAPARAGLVAAAGLNQVMVQAASVSNVALSYLELDGNRPARSKAGCSGYRINGTTLNLSNVTGGSVTSCRFTRAVCGSSLQFVGTSTEIAHNLFDDNGAGTEAPDAPEPWSDGLTLDTCNGANVHDNAFTDNTDVAIADGGGHNCRIVNNSILQLNRHVFAGIDLGNFTANGKGDHTGAMVSGNTIKGNGRMSFALAASMMPWANLRTSGGTLSGNNLMGAIVNLMIDGADNIVVSGNTVGATQGTALCGGTATPYTAGDSLNASLQPGYVSRTYAQGCLP